MLSHLKTFLSEHKTTSLFELSNHMQCDPEVIRDMLGVWIKKGCVRKRLKTSSCATKCVKCNPLLTEIYEWI